MTLPVSTSGGKQFCLPGFEYALHVAVTGRVVGDPVDPAAPDDADPRSCQHADRVGMVLAAGAGVGVDACGPGAFVAAVVGEGGDRLSEALVAGPAKVHRPVLAGLLRDRTGAGQGGNRVGA